jgi:hypothetical protein
VGEECLEGSYVPPASIRVLRDLTRYRTKMMSDSIGVSALHLRANLDKFLRRVEDEGRSLVIEKPGQARAVLLSGNRRWLSSL